MNVRPSAVALTPLQLGRASVTYALGGLAYKGVALLSVPILARLLTPAQLGLLDLAVVLASVVALAVAIGMDQGIPFLEPRSRPSPVHTSMEPCPIQLTTSGPELTPETIWLLTVAASCVRRLTRETFAPEGRSACTPSVAASKL